MDLLAVEIRQFPLRFVLKPKLSPEFKLQRSLGSVFSCLGTAETFRMDVECQFTPSVAPSLMYLFSFASAGLVCSMIHSFHDTREYPTFHLFRIYLKIFFFGGRAFVSIYISRDCYTHNRKLGDQRILGFMEFLIIQKRHHQTFNFSRFKKK